MLDLPYPFSSPTCIRIPGLAKLLKWFHVHVYYVLYQSLCLAIFKQYK